MICISSFSKYISTTKGYAISLAINPAAIYTPHSYVI